MIYERRCTSCDKVFDHLCNMVDRNKAVDCPSCGAVTQPIMSATKTDFKFADESPIKG